MEALNQSFHFNEVAEITLAYRPKIKASQRPKDTCSRQVYDVLLKFWNSDARRAVSSNAFEQKKPSIGNLYNQTGGTAGNVVDPKWSSQPD